MAWRSLWRITAKVGASTTAIVAGGGATAIILSDDPSKSLKLCTVIPTRLVRASFAAASISFDYQFSLWGIPEGSAEWTKIRHEVHLRSAMKLQEMCFKNGGIYIKLGQHLGQLEYLVPDEYVKTMRDSMLNRCPVSSYDQVCDVFKKELGKTPDKIFSEFNPVPFASASLAQVHAARTFEGEKVAVKVQHTHMTDTGAADQYTVGFIVNALHRLFPSFDYRWLFDEIRESLPKELDFLVEARNGEKCMENFRNSSSRMADFVYVPKIYWNLSTSKLLTMEYIDGVRVDDVKCIKGLGLKPKDVAMLVSDSFAEMMFKHGFVHCDPHAANLLVRRVPRERKAQLVLLDHGLYKELDFETRFHYASLWKAIVFSDADAIKENSIKLGAGNDLYALFAAILTMRPWNKVIDSSVDHLVIGSGNDDRSELQMYAAQYFPQITELMRRLPRVILLMLKTNDCLRAVNNGLVCGKSQFARSTWRMTWRFEQVKGSPLEGFLVVGKVACDAVIEAKKAQATSHYRRLKVLTEDIVLQVRLFAMHFALWIFHFRRSLHWFSYHLTHSFK